LFRKVLFEWEQIKLDSELIVQVFVHLNGGFMMLIIFLDGDVHFQVNQPIEWVCYVYISEHNTIIFRFLLPSKVDLCFFNIFTCFACFEEVVFKTWFCKIFIFVCLNKLQHDIFTFIYSEFDIVVDRIDCTSPNVCI